MNLVRWLSFHVPQQLGDTQFSSGVFEYEHDYFVFLTYSNCTPYNFSQSLYSEEGGLIPKSLEEIHLLLCL